MTDYKTIAESKNFIVLDKYTAEWKAAEGYQTEEALERELIQDLVNQGYEFVPGLNAPEKLLANVRVQLQALNNVRLPLKSGVLSFVQNVDKELRNGGKASTCGIHAGI